jgi:NAD(P)-dependent dehydrogenase (short-subunit alcohol dehydrogenase family)
MKKIMSAFGHLDVLVNNAGVPLKKPAVDITSEEWDRVIGTNMTGTFFMSQEMARHLLADRRRGCIINIASTHGLVGLPDRAAYSIAKGAVIHMARVLAVEWAAHGIRVNAVVPGLPGRARLPRDGVESRSIAAVCNCQRSRRRGLLSRESGGGLCHRAGTRAGRRPYGAIARGAEHLAPCAG